MKARIARISFTLAAALAVVLLPGAARAGGHDRDHRARWSQRDWRGHERNFDRDGDFDRDDFGGRRAFRRDFRDRDGDFDRDDFDRGNRGRFGFPVIIAPRGRFGPSGRPPGWDRGRKTGWGDCDVPPGLAKKEGCGARFFFFGSSRDFRGRHGRGRGFDRDDR